MLIRERLYAVTYFYIFCTCNLQGNDKSLVRLNYLLATMKSNQLLYVQNKKKDKDKD